MLPRAGCRGLLQGQRLQMRRELLCIRPRAEESHETTSYEETSTLTPFAMISSRQTECPACHSGHRFSVGFGFGSGCPGLHFVGPIVWFNKGDEPRCAGCEAQREVADSDDGHDGDANDMISMVPPAPSDAPVPNSGLVVTKDGNCFIFNSAPAGRFSGRHYLSAQSVVAPSIVFQGPGECAKSGIAPRAARAAAPR